MSNEDAGETAAPIAKLRGKGTTAPERRPQGRSMKELREIVAADTSRWMRLSDVWSDLTVEEQTELVHRAEAMARRGDQDSA